MSYSPPQDIDWGYQSPVERATVPFDWVIDEREPSRHHYFYIVDGTVVLRVS